MIKCFFVSTGSALKYEKGIVFIDNKKKKVSQRRKKEFITAYREYMAWR